MKHRAKTVADLLRAMHRIEMLYPSLEGTEDLAKAKQKVSYAQDALNIESPEAIKQALTELRDLFEKLTHF